MRMNVLSGGKLQMPRHVYFPDADRDQKIELPVSCFLLRHSKANVLFDTGCHPKVATDPEERWGNLAKFIQPVHNPGDEVLTGLAKVGLAPEDIDIVINSHLHCDHCGCNEFFTKATFVVSEKELDVVKDPDNEGKGYFRADWDHPMPIDALSGERDLFDDGRVVLIPLPGHSPGLTGALVGFDRDGTLLLASDAVNLRANLDHDISPKNTWQQELLYKSYEEVRRIEASGTQIICGHDAEQLMQMKIGLEAYD
ncbi:MAG: N-acyl homoserine lactonase family protein [Pseudomonadota bacterium]